MKRILVTGASGFLGWNVARVACAQGFEVWGSWCTRLVALPQVTMVQWDCAEAGGVAAMIERSHPDCIIHCAAKANPEYCEKNPQQSRRVNVDTVEELARYCHATGIRLVYVSTDLVFGGDRAPYRESDPVAPISVYGQQKVEAEKAVAASGADAVVCRMPLMYGEAGPVASSSLQPLLAALREGRQVRLFTDEYRTPASGFSAAQGLLIAAQSRERLLHLGGPERISRFAFGEAVAQVWGFDSTLLVPTIQADAHLAAPRPPDVSLDSSRAVALGYAPGGVLVELRGLRERVL